MITKVDDRLYRGPRPKSHKELADAGIKTVISLQSGAFDELHDDLYEVELAYQFGLEKHVINCSDIRHPNDYEVLNFLSIIQERQGPFYVHCLHGKDRTGFMVACYRIVDCGWSYDAAVKEMFELGFHKFPYLWWTWALKSLHRGIK